MPGTIGFTASLSVNDGSSNAQQAIPNVKMITLPTLDTAMIETTTLGSATPDKTFTPGLTDSGNLSFECLYTADTYSRLATLVGKLKHSTRIPPTGTDVTWLVTAPDEDGAGAGAAQTFTFNGCLTKIETSMEIEAVMMIKGEVKVSGNVTVG